MSRGSYCPLRGTRAPGYTSMAAGHTCRYRRRRVRDLISSSRTSPTSGFTCCAASERAGYARTRVHEYGGRSYLPVPSASGQGFDLIFANFADQRLYLLRGVGAGREGADGGTPEPLTPVDAAFRFADMALSPDGREVWCVRETARPDDGIPEAGFHTGGGMKVSRAIVAVPLDGSAAEASAADDADMIRVLVSGAHFFAFPTPSPDGTRLAWINWNHPLMPWDGTELRTGPVTGTTIEESTLIMGGPTESVLAPLWRDDENLYAVSDTSGWWNLYEAAAGGGLVEVPPARGVRDRVQVLVVTPERREHGLGRSAHDQRAFFDGCAGHWTGAEFGPIPGHQRVVPVDPRQPRAVGRRGGEREEVRPADEDPDHVSVIGRAGLSGGAVERHRDDRAADLHAAARVKPGFRDAVIRPGRLTYAPDLPAVGGQGHVREPEGGVDRRQRFRRAPIRAFPARSDAAQQVKPLVGEVREDEIKSLTRRRRYRQV